jgi:hypothetical protein
MAYSMTSKGIEYALDEEGFVKVLFLSKDKPSIWADRLSHQFELTEIEKSVLLSYLYHINPESLEDFGNKLLRSSRSYLDPFVDNDLEEFGEDMFRVNYEDLFDDTPSGTRGRLILYNTFVQNLREMTKENRMKQYEHLGCIFTTEDKRSRRTKLYTSFVDALRGMSKDQFECYQGIFRGI